MVRFMKAVNRFEDRIDKTAVRLSKRHPHLFFLIVFIGVALFILTAVCVGTIVIVFPVSWILGWI